MTWTTTRGADSPAAGAFAGVAVTIAGLPTVAINWSLSAGMAPRSARITRPHPAPMIHKRRTPIALALIHQFASPAILMWGQAETMVTSTRLGRAVPFASPAAFRAIGWICTLSLPGGGGALSAGIFLAHAVAAYRTE